jgi:hypothetical protein
MSFPDNCLKGISVEDQLLQDGYIASHLFYFNKQSDRDDDWCEQSINWDDDEHAIDFTLNQKKDGKVQFRIGVAILPRDELDQINKRPTVNGILSYERRILKENKYHGNILIKNNVEVKKRKQIAAIIALSVARIIQCTN